ncbi:hypothetical protein A8B78_11785 [Jannaschia sp. EhC01]|nr:hypothetical protein A8B78_11785 [Jannaschia sp. EhC01]
MTAAPAVPEGTTNTSATKLEYSLTPETVIAGSQQPMTFIATNPADVDRIDFKPGPQGDEIVLTIPAPPTATGAKALTDHVGFVAQSKTDGFLAGGQPGDDTNILIRPVGPTSLPPGGRIEVSLTPVEVNATPGQVSLGVQEYIGGGDASTSLGVTKQKAGLSITAWLSQQVAGKDETVTVFWQSAGGTVVEIAGIDEGDSTLSFPVEGKQPPYPGQYSFAPNTPGNRTLTLTVRTGSGLKEASTEVSLTVRAPYLSRFSAVPASGTKVRVDAELTLDWSVLYARAVSLTPPSGAGPQLVPAQPLRPMKRTPGADALSGASSVSNIPAKVDYVLTATGFAPQAQARIELTLEPVTFYYFKYLARDTNGQLSRPSFAMDPMSWSAYVEVLSDVNSFTLYQPGGTSETYFLGASDTTHPQILYFDTTAAPSGGKVTVEWQTANLTKLVLDPGGKEIAAADIAKGSAEVAVPADNLVRLTGTAANGDIVPSLLPIPPSPS